MALVSPLPQCIDVHGTKGLWTLGLYGCNGSDAQRWTLRGDQTVRWAADTSLCMTGEPSTKPSVAGRVTVAKCSETKAQKWQVDGFFLKNLSTNLCVEAGTEVLDVDGLAFEQPSLATCDRDNDYARWAFGDINSGFDAWQKISASFRPSVAQRCSFPVVVLGANAQNSAVGSVLGLYAGVDGLVQFLRLAVQEDCAQMFGEGRDVPPIRLLLVELLATDGAASAEEIAVLRRINVNSTYFAKVDERELPRKFRLDSLFHHEIAHILDSTADKPSGVTEGFANLISYRTGYLSDLQKVKGGDWTDGYSTASFFLDWLDVTYDPRPLGMRFTDRMLRAGRAARTGSGDQSNWFLPWVEAQTGKSLDALWRDYQAIFVAR